MGSFIQIFTISLSLAMDAFSVSIAGGMKSQKAKVLHALKVALFFGVFQAVMPLLGWGIGEIFKDIIASIAHWIAFFLLSGIGIKMIKEALDIPKEGSKVDMVDTKQLVLLAIATSIDAFIIGITITLIKIPVIISISIIGIITFLLSFVGFVFGKKIGVIFGEKAEIVGGIALILIGFKILIGYFLSS